MAEDAIDNSAGIRGLQKKERGYVGLNQVGGVIYEEMRNELRYPESIRTFKKMSYDPTIKAANNLLDILIGKVDYSFEVPEKASDKAKRAAEYLNWCMRNMEAQTWQQFINEVGSYRIYGFHVAEKVYTKVKNGRYAGKYKWKKLATRSQDTIVQWDFTNDGRELLGCTQRVFASYPSMSATFPKDNKTKPMPAEDIPIERQKFMLFRYDTTRENPEGNSPLKGCYMPWKLKTIIEEYEAVGVAKDLGGIPVYGVDVGFLSKANADPNSSEANILAQIQMDAANLHAGDKTHIIVPLAYDEAGKPLFDFKLVGVDGGGKQYNTDDIIKRKQNEILMLYLADVIKLGNDSVGSFALSESKNALLALAVEYHLKTIADVINNDLVPETLSVNGFDGLEEDEIPKLTYTDLDQVDMDNLSKFVQRAASVGMLPQTAEVVNEILEMGGLKYRLDESKPLDPKMFPQTESKAGEGMKTAGEGTANSVGGSDSSVSNTENA